MATLTFIEVQEELTKEWPDKNFGVTQDAGAIKMFLEKDGEKNIPLGTIPTACGMFQNSSNEQVLHILKTVVGNKLKEL